jgi:hypothetical protein
MIVGGAELAMAHQCNAPAIGKMLSARVSTLPLLSPKLGLVERASYNAGISVTCTSREFEVSIALSSSSASHKRAMPAG